MRDIMIRKILVLIPGFLIILSSTVLGERFMIADFDRGEKPNLIGGDFGTWNKSKTDTTQFSRESFNSNPRITYGGRGVSLQLDYDVDSPRSAYNGFWMRLGRIDLTPYQNFVFHVRGDENFGYTTKFKVELKNMEGLIASFLVEGVDDNWQRVTIPLEQMKQTGNWREAKEFIIIFEDIGVTEKVGRIYIDQIYLE